MDSAALTLTLFAHGWLYFNNAALTWDDGHHTVPAPEIDGTQIADLVMFANTECGPGSDLNDICSMALKGMQAVAAANIPREPREMLPSELLTAVPQGDITAVSLVQLLHDPQLWQAEQTGADAYTITCDARLASALPHCREMLSGLVDALRSVDPALTGAASYTFNLTGSDTPWDAASAPEPESEAEPESEPTPEPEAEAEPEQDPAPVAGPEPVAEVETVPAKTDDNQPNVLTCDNLSIHLKNGSVCIDGKQIDLTPTEFDLLATLALHPNVAMDRETLLARLGNQDCSRDIRLIDTQIKNLRAKLGEDTRNPRWIETVHGMGYRFGCAVTTELGMLPTHATHSCVRTMQSADGTMTLVINNDAHSVHMDSKEIHLTKTEYALLDALASRAGKTWTNEDLCRNVLEADPDSNMRVVATHIKNLRAKLHENARNPQWIKTVHGVGYQMIATVESGTDAIDAGNSENAISDEDAAPNIPEPTAAIGYMVEPEPADEVKTPNPVEATPALEPAAKVASRLETKQANEHAAMCNLKFPDFPQELIEVEPSIHTRASRYAVALYVIARVAPTDRWLTPVELRRAVRPYLMAAGLQRLSIPTLGEACIELASRDIGAVELDEFNEVVRFKPTRLTAPEALRVAMEFDTSEGRSIDRLLRHNVNGATEATGQAEKTEPSADPVPSKQTQSEQPTSADNPTAEAEVKVKVKKDSIQDRETELLEQLSEQISMLEKRLAALDPAPLRAKLDALTQERAGLGFFKFSAKKALDMRIEQVQQELSDLASKDADRAHLQTLLDTTVRTIDNMRKAHEEQA